MLILALVHGVEVRNARVDLAAAIVLVASTIIDDIAILVGRGLSGLVPISC